MMRSVSLLRTGLDDLVFDGELIAESNSCRDSTTVPTHEHALAIYRTLGGDWVVCVRYQGSRPDSIRSDVAILRDWEAVETALSRYPVMECVEVTLRVNPRLMRF